VRTGNWRLVVCGLTHKTSSLEQRELFQLGPAGMPRANALFVGLPGVLESAIVSTCNRIEFYFVAGRRHEPFDIVAAFYERFNGTDVRPHRRLFETNTGRAAADHLFRVAAGIESMVLGENQVLGQIKDDYRSACAVKAAGKVIHRLFHQAFRVGKLVRTHTAIGRGACSVSSAAAELLEDELRTTRSPKVVLVGVNQMIRLAAEHLGRSGGLGLVFANRTVRKALELAVRFESEGFGLDDLPELLAGADGVLSCTSSPDPIIDRRMMSGVMGRRPRARLAIVDMAVPRDVDLPKGWHPSVDVYDLEDIERFVSDRQRRREAAVPQAEEIIERKLGEFCYWYRNVLYETDSNGARERFKGDGDARSRRTLSGKIRD
jgi:glutamyl-tRNA reductase